MVKRAVTYCRYSSDHQRSESIEAQRRAIEEYADLEKIEIVREYVDEALSARTDDRPAFLDMINTIGSDIDYVIVHKLDRFSRDRYQSAFYRDKLKKKGIKLVSVLENFDNSPESVILESVIEGMNEYYSLNLAREVNKGKMENALSCRHNGGQPPLGYSIDENLKYVIDEREAIAVRQIFKMYASGKSYGDIINWLKLNNIRTKRGNHYKKNGLYSILKNEKYIGVFTYSKRLRVGNKYRNDKENPDVVRIENGIPRIIEQSVWNRVQNRMNHNRRMRASNKTDNFYLLSGKVYHECRKPMSGSYKYNKRKEKVLYYVCYDRDCSYYPKSVQALPIENQVINAIHHYIFEKDRLGMVDKIVENQEKNIDLAPYENRLKELIKQENNITNAILNGIINDSIKEQNEAIQSERRSLEVQIAQAKKPKVSREIIEQAFKAFGSIKHQTKEQQKRTIDLMVRRIIISDKRIKIIFYLTPPPIKRVGDIDCTVSSRPLISPTFIELELDREPY